MWWSKRRPEIQEDYDREILGSTPVSLPKVTCKVVSTTQEKNGDIALITRMLLGHVDNSADPAVKVDIDLTLSTPANATGPVNEQAQCESRPGRTGGQRLRGTRTVYRESRCTQEPDGSMPGTFRQSTGRSDRRCH